MDIKVFGMVVAVLEALHAEVTDLANEANPIPSSRSLARKGRLRQIKEQIDELNAVDINTGR